MVGLRVGKIKEDGRLDELRVDFSYGSGNLSILACRKAEIYPMALSDGFILWL